MRKNCIMCGAYLSDEELQYNGDICYECEEEFEGDDDSSTKNTKMKIGKRDSYDSPRTSHRA